VSHAGAWALDGARWRAMAHAGASRGPEWFVRIAPPVVGVIVLALDGAHRAAIASSLRSVRPSRGALADAADVVRTFTTYATCVTEVLRGPDAGDPPQAMVRGEEHLGDALADGKGVVVVTAHTAGWEMAGRLLLAERGIRVVIVDRAERDLAARAIQDDARRAQGVEVAHAGGDPFATLALLGDLRAGGVVALQIDRAAAGMRTRGVRLFGVPASIPEGPLRLASASGAPIVAAFACRVGRRRYELVVEPPLRLPRRPSEAELDAAAQRLADALGTFVERRPTQWFNFALDVAIEKRKDRPSRDASMDLGAQVCNMRRPV
jgi:lauroyl/myristoyl acyltransferase